MTNAIFSRLFQKMNLFLQNELAPHPHPQKWGCFGEYQTLSRNNLLHTKSLDEFYSRRDNHIILSDGGSGVGADEDNFLYSQKYWDNTRTKCTPLAMDPNVT